MAASPVYLGRYLDLRSAKPGTELSYGGERHLLLFGPNGAGKGARILVNNLLRLRDRSVVVIDPKGELAAITSTYRRILGDVVILNPFNVLELGSASFNPLASLDPDASTFVDDAAGLSEALVKIDPNEKDPHWSESARSLLTALIMWEVKIARHNRRMPTLDNVRFLLTEPNAYEQLPDGKRGRQVSGLKVTAAKMCNAGGYEIESLAGRFLRETDEIYSIQSTADRHTAWMLSPPMRDSMAKNDIDFATLKQRPTTVYLILPAERMRTHAVWLRLVIVSALRALYRPGGLRTLFMLDEFAQLGHLGPIEEAMALVRGYGIQLWPVLQDLSQLKALYGERTESFMANAGVVQFFAPNDLVTADWISRRAGDTTVAAAGYNRGDQQSNAGQGSISSGLSYTQQRRRLFLPQELMDFPSGSGLLFLAGLSKGTPFTAPPYWESDRRHLARQNPYYELAGKPVQAATPRAQAAAPPRPRLSETLVQAGRKYVPPATRATKSGAIAALTFLGWLGLRIAQEAPPTIRRLKRASLAAFGYLRKRAHELMTRYDRSKPLLLDTPVEPGPPREAGPDSNAAREPVKTAPSGSGPARA